jgi:hypothetical protein
MNASLPRRIVLVACVIIGGCGGGEKLPSYSVQETADQLTVVLHTDVTDIPVPIPKTGKGEGSGNRQGTVTRGGQTMSYEVKYEHRGKTYTLTSVTIDGQEIPKSP